MTTFLVPSSSSKQDPALSDPGGVATLGRRKRLSSSRLTETSDHIYAMVQPKDKRMSTTSSASLASSLQQPTVVRIDSFLAAIYLARASLALLGIVILLKESVKGW